MMSGHPGQSLARGSDFGWLFFTLFTPMMFGVMWGYPFFTVGQGLPRLRPAS